MSRASLSDLNAFLAVAREHSFTRAAAQLGVSPSALSQTVKGLEERLDVRLLTRTTRSVAPTEAGEQLIASIAPHMEGIERGIAALGDLSGEPSGTIRITSVDHAAEHVLWPALANFLADHPAVSVDIVVDNVLRDIVAERFDAGIRMGERVARDMIAVRIGPDIEMAAVATPAYFAQHGIPETPQHLSAHRCINMRMATLSGVYAWEFDLPDGEFTVRVDGQLTVNDIAVIRQAALNGVGIAFLPDDIARPHIESGEFVRILKKWTLPFPGYHLYYPSRRHHSKAFAAFVEALRYRG